MSIAAVADVGWPLLLGLLVAGALGAVLRLICDWLLPDRGILVANVAGSLLAGWATGAFVLPAAKEVSASSNLMVPDVASLLLITGLAGALTTFSTVSMATAGMILERRYAAAVGTWCAHLGLGAMALALGLVLGSALT